MELGRGDVEQPCRGVGIGEPGVEREQIHVVHSNVIAAFWRRNREPNVDQRRSVEPVLVHLANEKTVENYGLTANN